MVKHRIYEEARRAIEEHRWLESEKAGYNRGTSADSEWAQAHWLHFYRSRFVQHLRGEVFYEEFGKDCFALVSESLNVDSVLLDEVLNKVQRGAENLDVLCWAMHEGIPRETILNILKAVDINRRRLPPPAP